MHEQKSHGDVKDVRYKCICLTPQENRKGCNES